MFLHLSLLVLETPKGPKRMRIGKIFLKKILKGPGMSNSKTTVVWVIKKRALDRDVCGEMKIDISISRDLPDFGRHLFAACYEWLADSLGKARESKNGT